MYRPNYSFNENSELIFQLIQAYPLGLLISESSGQIESNYLPFIVLQEGDEIFLISHLAKANPHWKNLRSEVVVNFLGPNSYISPTICIDKNNVPTWSYAAVEIRGSVELITDSDGINSLLNQSVDFFETKNQTNWSYNIPKPMQKSLESAIMGLKIKITKIESKFKLSQNRSPEDYAAILNYFKESSSAQDCGMYDWMLIAPR